jgi:hypothetical protein
MGVSKHASDELFTNLCMHPEVAQMWSSTNPAFRLVVPGHLLTWSYTVPIARLTKIGQPWPPRPAPRVESFEILDLLVPMESHLADCTTGN